MVARNAGEPKKQATLGSRGQVTIPRAIRERAGLEPGDPFDVEIVRGGILLRSQRLADEPADSRAGEEWQEDEDDTGYDHVSKSDREFFESLEL